MPHHLCRVLAMAAWLAAPVPLARAAADQPLPEAALAAINACDAGAAVPLDPGAKAPPVWDAELMPADFDFTKLKPLALACAEAERAAPGDKRLQLQMLRIQIVIGGQETAAFVPLLRPFAEGGSAEAKYLLFRLFERFDGGPDADRLGLSRAEALAGLEQAVSAGHLEALATLFSQYRHGPLYRRDAAKALAVARQVAALPPGPWPPGRYESAIRAFMPRAASELVLLGDGFPAAEQAAAFTALEGVVASGDSGVALAVAAALRHGRGTAKDPVKARALLQQRADAGDAHVVPALAAMMAEGEGGPVDGKGAIALLRGDREKYVADAGPVLAGLLLDNRFVGRQPQEAARVLFRSGDIDAAIRLVDLVIDDHPTLDYPAGLVDRLTAAATVDEPGAALALARLKIFGPAPFTDVDGGRRLLQPLADKGDRAALYLLAGTQYAGLDSNTERPSRRDDGLDDAALKALIADGIARKEAPAFLLQAKLQRQGVLYPQDDQAATANLTSAANLGSVEAMVLLGEAYDEGLGVAKNPRERVHAWREAARRGSLDARERLAGAFTFDGFDKLVTLREGVTERIALAVNAGTLAARGFGPSGAEIAFAGLFSGSRANDAGTTALAHAVLDAFRLAPVGLDEAVLVPTLKALPDEIRVEMERILHQEGFYAGEPQGFWGPDARKALAAWVDAKGPLPDEADPQAATPAALSGGLPADIVDRVRARTQQAAQTVKSKAERRVVIQALNSLARYGDVASRWALVSNYHQADFVRNVVTPEEVTRYALDLMVRRPDGIDKLDFAVTFDVTQMMQDHKIGTFGTAFVAALRDTPALQDPLTLGGLMQQLVLAPGACDAVREAAQHAGAKKLGEDGCDETSRTALIALAKARGPAGVEEAARRKGAAEVAALDKGK